MTSANPLPFSEKPLTPLTKEERIELADIAADTVLTLTASRAQMSQTEGERMLMARCKNILRYEATLQELESRESVLREPAPESEQRDAERLDWIEAQLLGGQWFSLDREELEPDGGGPTFLGIAISMGPKDDGAHCIAGERSFREALDAAIADASSETREAAPAPGDRDADQRDDLKGIVSTYHGPVGGNDERGVVVRLCVDDVIEVRPEKGPVARLSLFSAKALAYSLLDFAIQPYAGDVARRAIEAKFGATSVASPQPPTPRRVLCGNCGSTYAAPEQEELHGTGKCAPPTPQGEAQ